VHVLEFQLAPVSLPSSLAAVKSRMVGDSGTSLPTLSWTSGQQTRVCNVCVCCVYVVCVCVVCVYVHCVHTDVAERLKKQHCGLTGVLAVNLYMSDIRHFALVNSIYVNYFSANPPARYYSAVSLG